MLELEDRVLDERGQLRLGVGKLVVYGHLLNGDLAAWSGELEERVRDPERSADERAAWAWLRGYAAEIERDPPQPLAGREWVQRAMETARSPVLRVRIGRYLADRFLAEGRHDVALAMLRELRDDVEGDALRATLARDAAAVESMATARREDQTRRAQRGEAARTEAAARYLRRRLAVAEAQGDAGRAARLREALAAAEEGQ